MDAAGIERVLLNTVGGVDTITLNDLSATGVTDVAADLGLPVGTGTGDGSADTERARELVSLICRYFVP